MMHFVDFSKQDMNKLMKDEYDANWRSIIDQAKTVSSLNETLRIHLNLSKFFMSIHLG